MNKLFAAFTLLAVGLTTANAQKITLLNGSLKDIKGETRFNVQYDYSTMRVGKFEKEADYVTQKAAEYNAKEAGRGDKWKESWVNDRKTRFQVKYEQLLNKYLEPKKIYAGEENKNAKYTMLLKTTRTEPGFNVYVTRKPAMIDVVLQIVETANPSNVVAEIVSKNNPGNSFGGNDFDTGQRIEEAYAKCGKELARWLVKNAFK